MTRRAAILALAIFFCLAGCGQKGPLRLPDEKEAETVEIEPAEAEQNENEQE